MPVQRRFYPRVDIQFVQYFNDQKQIIAKQNEEKLIRQEIYTAAIYAPLVQFRNLRLAQETNFRQKQRLTDSCGVYSPP